MRLALLGYPISHSLSPEIYRDLLGSELKSYDLLEIQNKSDIPSLTELAKRFDGLSITAPYKEIYFSQVKIDSNVVEKLGFINAISFCDDGARATNTDLLAAQKILSQFRDQFSKLSLIILGNGSMAKMMVLLAEQYQIDFIRLSRDQGLDLAHEDLRKYEKPDQQMLVINTCSRSFVFQGQIHSSYIFWDLNYSFLPHQNTLPSQVSSYIDGKEMVRLQAESALKFWRETNPKLKC